MESIKEDIKSLYRSYSNSKETALRLLFRMGRKIKSQLPQIVDLVDGLLNTVVDGKPMTISKYLFDTIREDETISPWCWNTNYRKVASSILYAFIYDHQLHEIVEHDSSVSKDVVERWKSETESLEFSIGFYREYLCKKSAYHLNVQETMFHGPDKMKWMKACLQLAYSLFIDPDRTRSSSNFRQERRNPLHLCVFSVGVAPSMVYWDSFLLAHQRNPDPHNMVLVHSFKESYLHQIRFSECFHMVTDDYDKYDDSDILNIMYPRPIMNDYREENHQKGGQPDKKTSPPNVCLEEVSLNHIDFLKINATLESDDESTISDLKSDHHEASDASQKQQLSATRKRKPSSSIFSLPEPELVKASASQAIEVFKNRIRQRFFDHVYSCSLKQIECTEKKQKIPIENYFLKLCGNKAVTNMLIQRIFPSLVKYSRTCNSFGSFIRNEFGSGSRDLNTNHNGRYMYKLDPEWIRDKVYPLYEFLNAFCGTIFAQTYCHKAWKGVCLLHSEKDCGVQHFHYDYEVIGDPTKEVFGFPTMSYSVLVSLQDGTRIDLSDNDGQSLTTTVSLEAGEIIIMCNNLCHRGCNYSETNYRLFFFLESPVSRATHKVSVAKQFRRK
jgi:hypothetical protein